MEYEHLLYTVSDQTAIVTLNRPKAWNALCGALNTELESAIRRADGDPAVRAIVLTGGPKVFAAGADVKQMADATPMTAARTAEQGQQINELIESIGLPVIAAVNGMALGGGCELAMACDFRIASSKAKFGQPEVGLGITPGFGGTQRLSKLVGKGMAKMLILTADTINAEEALRIGLVEKVTEPEQLMSVCEEIAAKIASKAPIAVAMSKTCINKGYHLDLFSGSALEAEAFGGCFGTEDQKEGMKAFLEKRPAEFKNK